MDQTQQPQQSPPQVQEADRPPQYPVLGLNEQQLAVLRSEHNKVMLGIFTLRFNEPEKDALTIRQHAYLQGAADAIMDVIRHDEKAAQHYKQQLQEATERALNPENKDLNDPTASQSF